MKIVREFAAFLTCLSVLTGWQHTKLLRKSNVSRYAVLPLASVQWAT
jgi:hypothetical protein